MMMMLLLLLLLLLTPRAFVDDNASSVGVLMEAIRVLTDFKWYNDFLNEVHFHFYAAEEIQLKGSKGLFNDYQSKGRQVMAMLNQDMSGYGPDDQKKDFFRIITDFTYKPLNEFMKLIIDEVSVSLPLSPSVCNQGFASDRTCANRRASWLRSAAVLRHPV